MNFQLILRLKKLWDLQAFCLIPLSTTHIKAKGLNGEDDTSKDNIEEERPLALQLIALLIFELIMGILLESSFTSISHAEVDDGSSSGSFSEGFNA